GHSARPGRLPDLAEATAAEPSHQAVSGDRLAAHGEVAALVSGRPGVPLRTGRGEAPGSAEVDVLRLEGAGPGPERLSDGRRGALAMPGDELLHRERIATAAEFLPAVQQGIDSRFVRHGCLGTRAVQSCDKTSRREGDEGCCGGRAYQLSSAFFTFFFCGGSFSFPPGARAGPPPVPGRGG